MSSTLLRILEVEPANNEPFIDGYDEAIDRALDAVRLHGAQALKVKVATRKVHQRLAEKGLTSVSLKRYPDYAVFDALIQRMNELRNEDPQQMLLYALMAVHTSRQMTDYPDAVQADLRARALAECANALRISDRLHEASEQLDLAERWYAAGTQDTALGLRLKDVRASLYASQEHYEDAIELLEEVFQGRLKLGDLRGAAKALVGKGLFTNYAGRSEEAFGLFDRSLELIDPDREPELRASTLHNKILAMVDAGRPEEALRFLDENRHELALGRINHVRLLGVEARISASRGCFKTAEHLLRRATQEFVAVDMPGHEALATLDLANVVLRQDRSRYSEAVTLATAALRIFSQLKVRPQVEEALNILLDAIQEGLVTATLLESVADFIRKADYNRRARYQPRFE
jgi:tetratricopeptide (TPR) repeat protein